MPRLSFLTDVGRRQFVVEAVDTLRACAALRRYTAFADLIEDWRNTADIMSDPELAVALTGDITEPLDIPVDQ